MAYVGFVTDSFAVNGAIFNGGAEQHLAELVKLAHSLGVRTRVFQPGKTEKQEVIEGITVHSLACDRKKIWKEGAKGAYDYGCTHVHFNYIHFAQRVKEMVVTGTDHGVWWDIPYVSKAKSWYPLASFASWYLPWWRKKAKHNTLQQIKKAKGVLSGDTSLLRIVQNECPEYRNRIHVVPNFFNLAHASIKELVGSSDAALVIQKAKQEKKKIILVPRNLSLVRGGHWLADIVFETQGRLGEACMFMVTGNFIQQTGRGGRYQTAFFESLPAAIQHSLYIAGGVPHDEMPFFYQQSDVVLIPTFAAEGGSLSAIEAMSYGKAVVATHVGGLNDVVQHGVTGLVCETTEESIAECLVTLLQNEHYTKKLGDFALLYAKAKFDLPIWQEQVKQFMRKSGWIS